VHLHRSVISTGATRSGEIFRLCGTCCLFLALPCFFKLYIFYHKARKK